MTLTSPTDHLSDEERRKRNRIAKDGEHFSFDLAFRDSAPDANTVFLTDSPTNDTKAWLEDRERARNEYIDRTTGQPLGTTAANAALRDAVHAQHFAPHPSVTNAQQARDAARQGCIDGLTGDSVDAATMRDFARAGRYS